jgi:RHS repeat-associated protein
MVAVIRAVFSRVRRVSLWLALLLALSLLPALPVSAGGEQTLTATESPSSTEAQPQPESQTAPIEIESERTDRSRVYALENGLREVQIYPGTINYRDSSGAFAPVDNTLKPDADGNFVNASNRYTVALPADASRPVRIAAGASWLQFGLRGAVGAPDVSGSRATYTDALPGVTAVYEAGNDQVKETLVLSDARQSSFMFDLAWSDGSSVAAAPDGGIDVASANGTNVMRLLPPSVVDANGASGPTRLSIDKSTLTLSVDPSWLSSADRRFPVAVDPSTLLGGPYTTYPDCTINSTAPTVASCALTTLNVSSSLRSLVRFDDLTNWVPHDAVVQSADLNLLATAVSGSQTVAVTPVAKNWTTGVTWKKYDGSNNWATSGGDITGVGDAEPVSTSGVRYHFYPTKAVQDMVSGAIGSYGFIITNTAGTVSFGSFNAVSSSSWPSMSVFYTPRLGTPGFNQFTKFSLNDQLDLKVNVANGNLVVIERGPRMQGTGPAMAFDHFYNSLDQAWRFAGGRDVNLYGYPGPADQTLFAPSGTPFWFRQQTTGGTTYDDPPGINASLTWVTDHFELKFHSSEEVWKLQSINGAGIAVLREQKDRNGNKISYSYDNATGRLTSIADTQNRAVTVAYDGSGRIATLTDVLSRAFAYNYDSNGRVLTSTMPGSTRNVYAYDASGNLTRVTDPGGHVTAVGYDSSHRVTSVARLTDGVSGPTTSFSYTDSLLGTATGVVTDPNSHATTYRHNNNDLVTGTIDALGNLRASDYSPNFDVSRFTDALHSATQFSYNSNSSLSGTVSATGSTTSYGYSNTNHPFATTQSTDPQGNQLAYSYDAGGNLTGTTSASAGVSVSRQLNANGTTASVKDGNGNTTTYGYDASGNLTSITPPTPLGRVTITPDAVSRVSATTDGKGQTTKYAYDSLDRVIAITDSANSAVAYSYDADGNLIQRVDSRGTWRFAYDALNRPTYKTFPDNTGSGSKWDAASNLTAITDTGVTTSYSYGPTNLVTTLTDTSGSATTFAYDSNGKRTLTTFPNGIKQAVRYDLAGREVEITGTTSGGAILTHFTYSYADPTTGVDRGLRYSMTDASSTTTQYRYDALNRLSQSNPGSATCTYGYDNNGNRTSRSGTASGCASQTFGYNASNENTTAGYAFDADGNETGLPGSGDNDLNVLGYNPKNQTITFTVGVNAGHPATSTASYADATQKERTSTGKAGILGTTVTGGGSTTINWSRDPDGNVIAAYNTTLGTKGYFLYDGLGSIVAGYDQAGVQQASYTYDAFGQTLTSSGSLVAYNPFGFVQGESSAGGLIKFGDRHYNPADGRWTQQDPVAGSIETPTSLNRFAYVNDDPVNSQDRTGLGCGAVGTAFDVLGGFIYALGSENYDEAGVAIPIILACGFYDSYDYLQSVQEDLVNNLSTYFG